MHNKSNEIPVEQIVLSEDLISRLLCYFPDGVVALDLETTGLSPLVNKVVELAMVKITKDRKVWSFSTLVNPEVAIPQVTIDIHGITDEMVIGAPRLFEIWEQVERFWQLLPMIAHNGKFDLGFIVSFLKSVRKKLPRADIYDSCVLGRALLIGEGRPENYKLGTLAKYFEVPLHNHHRAMDDALACLTITAHTLKPHNRGIEFLREGLRKSLIFNLRQFEKSIEMDVPLHLRELILFAETEQDIWIEYIGGSITDKYRPVRPLGLLVLPSGTVLNALCLLSDRYKNFSLKKIKSIKTSSPEQSST